MQVRGKPSPYQRIIRAAKRGVGVRLTRQECFEMSLDDAIVRVASNDDEIDKGLHPDTGEPLQKE